MDQAIYNSGIPSIVKSVIGAPGPAHACRLVRCGVFCALVLLCTSGFASDWSNAEKQLAQKIVAMTGPGAATITVQNRSSLSKRDTEIVQNGLRSALEDVGLRLVNPEQAAASISIVLSENQQAYVWVAEVRQGTADPSVVMVSLPGSTAAIRTPDSMPMALRKTLLWSSNDSLLDVVVLEENSSSTRIAVLTAENLLFYRLQAGKWQSEQTFAIRHASPWPRDLRGRIIATKDHGFDVYLPGVFCQTTAVSMLNCQQSDDPWPLGFSAASGASGALLAGFYAPRRNFFTGVISPAIGKFNAVPGFYSAAFLPRDKYVLWLFASTDGKLHVIDGIRDQVSITQWGSDITTVKTTCGAGWQVLATNADGQSSDSVRAYEMPDRDPIAVSAPIDFPGAVSALWTDAGGDSAIAVARNHETGSYEAYRLTLACN